MQTPSPSEVRKLAQDAARLATELQRAGRPAEASSLYLRALRLDQGLVSAWCNLGVARRALGDIDGAEEAFRQTLALSPDHEVATTNLASVLEARNQPEAARALASRAVELCPDAPAPRLVLARLARAAGDLVDARRLLDGIPADALSVELKPRYWTERGMTLDRLGQTDAAFAAFQAANDAVASTPESRAADPESYPKAVRTLRAASPEILSALGTSAPDDGEPPVFVIGFPRSGTTLVETILSAHPHLRGSDELPLLESVLGAVPKLLPGRSPYPAGLTSPLSDDERGLLRAAWRQLAQEHLGPGPRVIDKLPLNLVHLAALALIFPDAPLVFVLRDPRDVCLSNFMQDFVPNAAMVQMQSLERIVALQEQVMDLWFALRERIPNATLVVRYEEMIADQQGAARRLLDHLDLEWHDAVTQFWESARGAHISTPSHQDVARPIFTRSRGRWHRYRAHLAPVLPRLDDLAETLGYPRSTDGSPKY